VVVEVVAQVLVPAGPVDEHAAVGPDAAAEGAPGRGVEELLSPRLEHDPALVLLAVAVLREEAREMGGIRP
jgi:hypothetical protein